MSGIEKKMEDNTAIDFLKLLRAEKRRARQQVKTVTASSSKTIVKARGSTNDKVLGVSLPVPNKATLLAVPDWNHSTRISEAIFPTLHPMEHRIAGIPPSQSIDSIHYIPEFLAEPYQKHLLQWLQALPEQHQQRRRTGSKLTSNEAPQEGCWNRMTYGKRRVALFSSSETSNAVSVRLPSSVKDLCQNLLSSGGAFATEDSPATKRPGSMPLPLQDLCDALVTSGVFESQHRPNHILLNEYQPGQGILPHTDGPVYHSQTATLSIGQSNVFLNFAPRLATKDIGIVTKKKDGSTTISTTPQVLLEGNGSLIIFANDAYTHYTHGINVTDVEVASADCVNAAPMTLVQRGYRISLTFRHKL